ncbi:MAG: hypothetical protein MUP92_04510 [Actinobacteria bacterium]|nr:hypothetical protein [Actinomycetota bacterium]
MNDWMRALLIGGIVGMGLAPIVLLVVYIPYSRRPADEEVSPEERMAVLKRAAIAIFIIVGVAAGVFLWLDRGAPDPNATAPGIGGTSGGMPGAGGTQMDDGGFTSQTSVPSLPDRIAGLDKVSELTGDAALQQVATMHPSEFPLTGAIVGNYQGKGGKATMWVAVNPSDAMAPAMAEQMATAIGGGETPFTEPIQVQPGVYESEGLGQMHYFFAAGNGVWWLSVDPPLAEKALQQALAASKN